VWNCNVRNLQQFDRWTHYPRQTLYISHKRRPLMQHMAHIDLKGRYTLSVKLSEFTVWRHAWRKNWVTCTVLTGNSADFRTVLSSRLSHRELCSSLRESHSFLSLPVFIRHSHTHKKTHKTAKKTDNPNGKPVLCQRTFSSVFRAVFFFFLHSWTPQFNLGCMGPFMF